MYKFSVILLLGTIPMIAQTTTITCSISPPTLINYTLGFPNNVICQAPPSTGLPPGLIFDGITFIAPNISTGSLTLTGGPSLPSSTNNLYLYLLDSTSNTLQLTPYIPPVIPPSPPSGGSCNVVATNIAVPSYGTALTTGFVTSTFNYTNTKITTNSVVNVTVVSPPTGTQITNTLFWQPVEWIPGSGSVSIAFRYVWPGGSAKFPGALINIEVC